VPLSNTLVCKSNEIGRATALHRALAASLWALILIKDKARRRR
jgi:hypothetical protein